MTTDLPVQKFRIGQRVQLGLCEPFVIQSMFLSHDGRIMYAEGMGRFYEASILTLAPERPPYVPSERRVVGRAVTIARYQPELYRCETDTELAARHADERAAYDAQGDGA